MTNPFQEEFHAAFGAPRDLLVTFTEQKMGTQVTGLERVTQGYANEVYYADLASSERLVVRIRRRGVTSFATEVWALEAARRAGVPVPEVYALETLGAEGGLEVMLLSLVPGRPLGELWTGLNEGERLYEWAWLSLRDLSTSQPGLAPLIEPGFDRWFLARRNLGDPGEIAYYVVFAPQPTTLAEAVRVAGTKWVIETGFEAVKGEAGIDEYETRSWAGPYRHITLSLLAHAFLSVVRSREAKKGTQPTLI